MNTKAVVVMFPWTMKKNAGAVLVAAFVLSGLGLASPVQAAESSTVAESSSTVQAEQIGQLPTGVTMQPYARPVGCLWWRYTNAKRYREWCL